MRILDQSGGLGNLDLFTSQNAGGNESHIVFGQNGQISGQNSRVEVFGNLNGFRFSTTVASGIYLFSRNSQETARIGTKKPKHESKLFRFA